MDNAANISHIVFAVASNIKTIQKGSGRTWNPNFCWLHTIIILNIKCGLSNCLLHQSPMCSSIFQNISSLWK